MPTDRASSSGSLWSEGLTTRCGTRGGTAGGTALGPSHDGDSSSSGSFERELGLSNEISAGVLSSYVPGALGSIGSGNAGGYDALALEDDEGGATGEDTVSKHLSKGCAGLRLGWGRRRASTL